MTVSAILGLAAVYFGIVMAREAIIKLVKPTLEDVIDEGGAK